tara:strand:- start:859 stop:1191 length:333 start_codon:yes stop_codon:yes gene_type:complete
MSQKLNIPDRQMIKKSIRNKQINIVDTHIRIKTKREYSLIKQLSMKLKVSEISVKHRILSVLDMLKAERRGTHSPHTLKLWNYTCNLSLSSDGLMWTAECTTSVENSNGK